MHLATVLATATLAVAQSFVINAGGSSGSVAPATPRFKTNADVVSAFLSAYDALRPCSKKCVIEQLVTVSGSANAVANIITFDDVVAACQESELIAAGYLSCVAKCPAEDQPFASAWISVSSTLCQEAAAQDIIHIALEKTDPSAENKEWSKYYNSTMTNYDWVNLREAIKTIVQVKQYGPVFLRLAWHDSATGNIWTGTGGPHSTMSLQDPEDPQNKGLQRAIDALDPLYDIYDGKISRADLWSYAGAVAVRVMGGPNTKWRPGRNDITHLSQARLKSPDNNIPLATDNWPTIVNKFKSMGLNESDIAALIHGGHGVGRCHREYSGYHGPWTGQENTFSSFYGTFRADPLLKTNESLPAINSWQRNGVSPVNGALVMELPSDVAIVNGLLDFDHSPQPGVPGPAANKDFLSFSAPGRKPLDGFFNYFAESFQKLLEVTLDPAKLGGFVSTDPAETFGWVPVA